MPIQVNLNDLEAPAPTPAPQPQQVPSWAQPLNRSQRLAPADVVEVDTRPLPRSDFYAGQRVSVDSRRGSLAFRRGSGWRVELEDGATVFVEDDSTLEAASTPRSHWLDEVLESIASPAEVFLLGESTHGTKEYYSLRFELVQSLIELKGVSVVAVEGDAVAAARVDAYVRGISSDKTAEEALRGFTGGKGTTSWLWRNREVVRFVDWLRERNISADVTCGFAGLDLFSARASARAVVEYLELVDPPASRTAAELYGCFLAASEEDYSKACLADARHDARGATQRVDATRNGCERVLSDLQTKRYEYWDIADAERHFNAERNAEVVVSAQQFYAKRLTEPDVTWSIRDQHMSQGLLRLRQDLELLRGAPPRIAVLAHNSHVGDGRATEQSRQWNIGYLARETFGAGAAIMGFSTYSGSVTALPADDRERPLKHVLKPALSSSAEALLHANYAAHPGPKVLNLRAPHDDARVVDALRAPRPQRFVGVNYMADDERRRHYIDCRLPEMYDCLVYVDETSALEPLYHLEEWDSRRS